MSAIAESPALLADDDAPPYTVERAFASSPYVFICDHAGQQIPRRLGDLGVSADDLQRHIAWDIGAAAVARQLGDALDAFVICQTYSRLVIDCNRPLDSPGSIVARSEATDIPGNSQVTARQASERANAIFTPYHARIAAELDHRVAAARPALLVAVHSFTPVYHGVRRPWHIGMLYGRDRRMAARLLDCIRADGRWIAGDNEPYAVTATTDYAIPVHGEGRNLPHIGIELRQDLVAHAQGQREWSARLAGWLRRIAPEFVAASGV